MGAVRRVGRSPCETPCIRGGFATETLLLQAMVLARCVAPIVKRGMGKSLASPFSAR